MRIDTRMGRLKWVINNTIVDSDAAEIDRKTVLDLCAHMFHMKDED